MRRSSCVLSLAIVAMVGVMLWTEVGAAQQKITLRLAAEYPDGSPNVKSFKYFAEELAKASGGRIEVLLFIGGQLGTQQQTLEQIKIGSLEMANSGPVYFIGWLPDYAVFGLPFLFRDRQHMFAVVDGKVGKDLFLQLEKVGFKGLSWMDAGSRSFYTKSKPINTPADLKGMKIRVPDNPVMIDTIKALGASATTTAFSEVYMALQTGVMDGAENSATSVRNMGHFEVSKFFSVTDHIRLPDLLVMNLNLFNKLPGDLQKAVLDTGKKTEQFQRKAWLEAEEADLKFIESKGMKINTMDKRPFVEASKPVYDKYGAKFSNLVEQIRNTK